MSEPLSVIGTYFRTKEAALRKLNSAGKRKDRFGIIEFSNGFLVVAKEIVEKVLDSKER